MSTLTIADPSDVRDALSFLDPDDRDLWVKMGMAVKVELGAAGFDLWDEWSSTAPNYNAKAAKSSWKSFKDSGRLGIGTLFYLAAERGYKRKGEAHVMTPAEIAERKAKREAAERAIVDEQEQVAAKALAIWNKLPMEGASEYLTRKKVRAFGLRFAKDGAIAVPFVDFSGKLWGLQFIQADGTKRFMSGMAKAGHFHRIKGAGVLAVAEGYATAATIHMATGWTVLVAFTAENLLPVAVAAREKWPERTMIICGDNDQDTPGNPGRAWAEKAGAAVDAAVVLPNFDGQ